MCRLRPGSEPVKPGLGRYARFWGCAVPFRPVDIHVTYGKPELLVRAGPGDVEIQVSCAPFASGGLVDGPNYIVGVKTAGGAVAGEYVTSNEWSSDLSGGDELWVAAAEELGFTSSIRITGLIRSE